MKILIINNWAANFGDRAIILSMLEEVRRAFPGAEIVVESSHPEDAKTYLLGVTIVPRMFNARNIKHTRKVNSAEFFLKNIPGILSTAWIYVISRAAVSLGIQSRYPEVLSHYRAADLVISAGGDFISELYGLGFLLRLHEFNLVKKLNKPLVLFAQSIGPFRKQSIPIVRRTLRKVDLVIARDQKTYDALMSYGVNENVVLTADSAIVLPLTKTRRAAELIKKLKIDSKTIIMTIRDAKFTEADSRHYENYIVVMRDFMTYVQTKGLRVVLLAANPSDLKTYAMLKKRFRLTVPVIDALELYPGEIKTLFAAAKVVVTTRMHPAIVAATAGTPVIGIGREFKLRSFLEYAGLGRYYLDITEITLEGLRGLFEEMIARYGEVKSRLKKHIPVMQRESRKNIAYAKQVYERRRV